MALIALKCSSCGGVIQMDDSKESGFCMYCGNRFLVKDEILRISVEHSGQIGINRTREAENLAIRANQKIDDIEKSVNDIDISKSGNMGNRFLRMQSIRNDALQNIRNDALVILRGLKIDYVEKALDIEPQNQLVRTLKARIEALTNAYLVELERLKREEKRDSRSEVIPTVIILIVILIVFMVIVALLAISQ